MALGQEALTRSGRPRSQNSSSRHAKPPFATRVARSVPVLDSSDRQQLVLLWFCSHDFSVAWLCESSTFSYIFVKWTRLTDPKSGVQSIMYYELLSKNLLRSGFPLFSSTQIYCTTITIRLYSVHIAH